MRIVLISTDKEPTPPSFGGAVGTWVFEFASELAKMGHEVHVIGIPNTSINYDDAGLIFHPLLIKAKLKALESLLNGKQTILQSSLNVMRALGKLTKREQVDIIQTHYFNTWITWILFKARLKVQLWHNTPKANFINKTIARNYDLICGVSKYICERIVTHLNVEPKNVALIPDFVDTEFMKPNSLLRKSYREKLGLDSSEFAVLYVSRIIPQKGLHHLLVAFAKASRSRDMKLLIVGPKGHFHMRDLTYFNYIKHLADSLNILRRILWLGRVPREELPGIYNACDTVVIPTLMEEGGVLLTTLEAMACGKPVVAYDAGALSEAITHGRTGVLVRKGDVRQLSLSLIQLAEDSSYRERLGSSARRLCEEKFSRKQTVNKAVKIYTSFIEGL